MSEAGEELLDATSERIELGAVEISATDVAAGRRRLPIAMMGTRYKGTQKIVITRPMLQQVVANFRKRDNGEVPVDYEHGTLDAPAGQPVPASGWIKAIDDAPDAEGILWGDVEWTPKAAGMIAAKEYKYISPVIEQRRDNKDGAPQGWTLTSAALTNTPVLLGMPALVCKEGGWEQHRGDAGREKTVKISRLVMADRAARTVRAVLDDGQEITLSVEGLEAPVKAPKILVLSDVTRTAAGELDFGALDISEDVVVSGEVFRAYQAQLALSEAIKAGKILPAQRAAYERMALSDLKSFRELVATMKPQLDLGTRGSGATEGSAVDAAVQIDALVKQRIVASAGKTSYAEALPLVLREHSELAAAYKAQMGTGGK